MGKLVRLVTICSVVSPTNYDGLESIQHLRGVREVFLSCKACLAQLDRASDSNAWNLKAVSSILMVGLFLSQIYM